MTDICVFYASCLLFCYKELVYITSHHNFILLAIWTNVYELRIFVLS